MGHRPYRAPGTLSTGGTQSFLAHRYQWDWWYSILFAPPGTQGTGGTLSFWDSSYQRTGGTQSFQGPRYPDVPLIDTGSYPTFIRRDVLDRMFLVGAAAAAYERPCGPRCWGGFGESAPLRTSTSIRLSVQLFRINEPSCSLAVRACLVPPSVMQRAVLLGRNSWMHFNTRSYRAKPCRPHGNRVRRAEVISPRQDRRVSLCHRPHSYRRWFSPPL